MQAQAAKQHTTGMRASLTAPEPPTGRDDENGLAHNRMTAIQRARMLAAMAEVCSELGAANVTVAHVVARCGVSRRTFYEQFADREDCFLAAVDEALQCACRYVVAAYESDDARWRKRIRAGLEALLSFLDDEPYLGRLLVVETLGAGDEALRRRQEVLAPVLAAVDEGRSEARNGQALPTLTAEGVVGGVLSVLHARLADPSRDGSLLDLTGQLMSMLVLPYLGTAAAQRESRRTAPRRADRRKPVSANPLHDLGMRLTYRTIRVLLSVAQSPGASNRQLGIVAEIGDQGQISKLLTRLQKLGLVENTGAGHARGAPNAWSLTERGAEIQRAIAQQAGALNAA
jgi:AcrR family transcriptional regulator/DNA-binding MarR family transcriptional regulator